MRARHLLGTLALTLVAGAAGCIAAAAGSAPAIDEGSAPASDDGVDVQTARVATIAATAGATAEPAAAAATAAIAAIPRRQSCFRTYSGYTAAVAFRVCRPSNLTPSGLPLICGNSYGPWLGKVVEVQTCADASPISNLTVFGPDPSHPFTLTWNGPEASIPAPFRAVEFAVHVPVPPEPPSCTVCP